MPSTTSLNPSLTSLMTTLTRSIESPTLSRTRSMTALTRLFSTPTSQLPSSTPSLQRSMSKACPSETSPASPDTAQVQSRPASATHSAEHSFNALLVAPRATLAAQSCADGLIPASLSTICSPASLSITSASGFPLLTRSTMQSAATQLMLSNPSMTICSKVFGTPLLVSTHFTIATTAKS